MESEPTPPFPAKKLPKPGIEANLRPRPKYEAPRYKPAGKLEGKAALITGGDSGIGRAVAVMFAREGADVAITALPAEKRDSDETRKVIEGLGRRCVVIEGDLTSAQFCHDGRTFKTNVYAFFRLVKAALPHLESGASIIVTGSETGFEGPDLLPDYSASKGAIHTMTKVFAKQLARRGIRVNCVAPGPVWTPLNAADEGATPDNVKTFGAKTPLERPAQPEELAPAYVFLASDADSSYVTGEVLAVMGGGTTPG